MFKKAWNHRDRPCKKQLCIFISLIRQSQWRLVQEIQRFSEVLQSPESCFKVHRGRKGSSVSLVFHSAPHKVHEGKTRRSREVLQSPSRRLPSWSWPSLSSSCFDLSSCVCLLSKKVAKNFDIDATDAFRLLQNESVHLKNREIQIFEFEFEYSNSYSNSKLEYRRNN